MMTIPNPELTPEVIGAINSELQYQNSFADTDRSDGKDHGVVGQLVTLSVYARKAEEAWVHGADEVKTLQVLRKVAAIACRAMLLYGAYNRTKYLDAHGLVAWEDD